MAFPLSPVNGQTATINGISHVYNSTSGTWTRVVAVNSYTSANAPTNPNIGDIWYDTATDDVYRYTTDGVGFYWLDITGPTVANAVTYLSTNVYANSFNGSSQYLSVPTSSAFNFGTGDFTIECWINISATGISHCILSSFPATTSPNGFEFLINPTNYVTLDTWSYPTEQAITATSNPLVINTWNHVAVSKASGTFRIFVNGIACTFSGSSSQAIDGSTGVTITVGFSKATSYSHYLNGHISNLRVVKGTAVYTTAFAVPTAPLTAITNTQLLTCQTVPIVDASTNTNQVTNVGGVGLSIYSAQQTPVSIGPVTLPDSTQFITANSLGMHNRIINGAMTTDQRNSGSSQTITAAAALAYTVDRWYAYSTGANVTGQQVAGSGALQYLYQFTGAASVTAIGFAQRIEAVNSYDLNGSTVTLSAYLANSLLTTVTWTAYYATSADTFGTLASPTRTQIATGSWAVTSTLTRYATNIAIPAAATTGIEIVFTVGAQISGTWRIGAVQLEPGTVATPFERRPVGTELALCQRYFQVAGRSFGVAISSSAVLINQQCVPTMRTTPSVTLTTTSPYIESSPWVVVATTSGCSADGTHMTLYGGEVKIAGTISGIASNQAIEFGGSQLLFTAEL
jgi:hypothetical protein